MRQIFKAFFEQHQWILQESRTQCTMYVSDGKKRFARVKKHFLTVIDCHTKGCIYEFLGSVWTFILTTVPLLICLDFWKMDFEKWISTNSIFGLFWIWFYCLCSLQKSSSSKSIFRIPFFKNQVQINRGSVP